MKLKNIKWGTILWILAIGSCAIGKGLNEGIGNGFIALGACSLLCIVVTFAYKNYVEYTEREYIKNNQWYNEDEEE